MGLEKKKTNKLGCEKYFCRVKYWAPLGMLESVMSFMYSSSHHFFFQFHCFFGSALQILLQFLFAAGGALGVYKESGGPNQLQLREIVWSGSPRCDGIQPSSSQLYSSLHTGIQLHYLWHFCRPFWANSQWTSVKCHWEDQHQKSWRSLYHLGSVSCIWLDLQNNKSCWYVRNGVPEPSLLLKSVYRFMLELYWEILSVTWASTQYNGD